VSFELAIAFRDGASIERRSNLSFSILEEGLRHALERARLRWPAFEVGDALFSNRLGASWPKQLEADEYVASVEAEDFYLALGCLERNAKAEAELNRRMTTGPALAVERMFKSASFADEVRQRTLERLLMPGAAGRAAKLAEYAGLGPLDGWLHAVALRVALNLKEGNGREVPVDEEALLALPAGALPELDYARARFRQDFCLALSEAVASLSGRERTLLRMSLLDGLSIDKLGIMFGVHRATVARWISAAKETLRSETESRLSARLSLEGADLVSLMRLADSQLELSLGTLLNEDA